MHAIRAEPKFLALQTANSQRKGVEYALTNRVPNDEPVQNYGVGVGVAVGVAVGAGVACGSPSRIF